MSRMTGGSPGNSLGLCLRERYRVPKELPAPLITLVEKLVGGNPSQTLVGELAATEDSQLA